MNKMWQKTLKRLKREVVFDRDYLSYRVLYIWEMKLTSSLSQETESLRVSGRVSFVQGTTNFHYHLNNTSRSLRYPAAALHLPSNWCFPRTKTDFSHFPHLGCHSSILSRKSLKLDSLCRKHGLQTHRRRTWSSAWMLECV